MITNVGTAYLFFFSSRRRHTRYWRDWSSDVCSSDLFTQKLKVILIANRPELTIFQGFLNRTLGLMSMGTGAKFAAMTKVSKLWKGFVEVLSIINAIVQGRKAGCVCDFAIVSVIKANSSSGMASPSQTV